MKALFRVTCIRLFYALLLRLLYAVLFSPLLVGIACQKRLPTSQNQTGFVQTSSDAIILLVLDVSGSFENKLLTGDCRAFKFATHLLQQLQEQGAGINSRLQISLISGSSTPIFFDGTFRDFGERFPDGDSFRKALLKNRDTNGSRVHDTISDSIEFAMVNNQIKSETRLGLFVLSDFEDNFGDTNSLPRLKRCLSRWEQHGGIVGFYWVDQRFYQRWRGILAEVYPNGQAATRSTISIAETDMPSVPILFKP